MSKQQVIDNLLDLQTDAWIVIVLYIFFMGLQWIMRGAVRFKWECCRDDLKLYERNSIPCILMGLDFWLFAWRNYQFAILHQTIYTPNDSMLNVFGVMIMAICTTWIMIPYWIHVYNWTRRNIF